MKKIEDRNKCKECGQDVRNIEKMMNYFEHLIDNFKAGIKLAILSLFHFVHGVIRTEKTSHKYWGIE